MIMTGIGWPADSVGWLDTISDLKICLASFVAA
jgi:hypothetical protein